MFKQNLFRSMQFMSMILLLNGFIVRATPAQVNIPMQPPQRQLYRVNHIPEGMTTGDWSQIHALMERQDDLVTVSPTADYMAQQAFVKATNTDEADFLGRSVAVSGDKVVIGAYHKASSATGVNGNQNDNLATNAGAAYIITDINIGPVELFLPVVNRI